MLIRSVRHHSLTRVIWLTFSILLQSSLSSGAKGNFKSFDFFTNKRLPYILKAVTATSNDECRKFCEKNEKCEAFALSLFERKCNLYSLQINVNPVSNAGYKLYVITKTEDDGYYLYGANYIKVFTTLMNARDGNNVCKKEGGMLVAITDDDFNSFVVTIMNNFHIFNAFIGVTDELEELKWLYYDGTPCSYDSTWDYNGRWYRRDKNCAILRPNKNWYQRNCGDLQYFVCQIPLV